MRISRKLVLGFSVLVVLTSILGIVNVVGFGNIGTKATIHQDSHQPLGFTIVQIRVNLAELVRATEEYDADWITEEESSEVIKERIERIGTHLEQLSTVPGLLSRKDIDDIKDSIDEIYDLSAELFLLHGETRAAKIPIMEEFDEKIEEIDVKLDVLYVEIEGISNASMWSVISTVTSNRTIGVSILAAVILVALGTTFVVSRSVSNPITQLKNVMIEISEGDLTKRATIKSKDEIGELAGLFNHMTGEIQKKDERLKLEITERKQAEKEVKRLYNQVTTFNIELEQQVKSRTLDLETALQAAQAATRAKSEFLASMSHELRTPLTAIIGFSEVLQEQYFGELNEKQLDYSKDILESGRHLLSLINDILELATLESAHMELDLSDVVFSDLLTNSMLMVKEKTDKHRIALTSEIAPDVEGLKVSADARMLRQVIFNLLSNAAKFTPDGGSIKVTANQTDDNLVLTVSDTGIGVAPEYLEKVFEGFFQVESGVRDKTPGTGTGLATAKRFVEMHGGKIWVESAGEGKGSQFTFTIPLSPSA